MRRMIANMDYKMRLVAALMILLCLSFCSGCYGKRELQETGYVLAFGVDKGENGGIYLIAQVAIPQSMRIGSQGGSGGDEPVWNMVSEGKTLFEAMKKLSSRSPRRLFWAHATTMVLTEDLAKEGIAEVLDIITRERQFKKSMRVLVTADDLKEIFSVKGKLEPVFAFYVRDLENLTDTQSRAPRTTVRELLDALYSVSPQPMLARVSIWRGEEGGGAQESEEESGDGEGKEQDEKQMDMEKKDSDSGTEEEGGSEQRKEGDSEERERTERQEGGDGGEGKGGAGGAAEPPSEISIEGSAAFRRDRIVGWLSAVETRGVMWAKGLASTGVTVINAPGASGLITIRHHDSFASIRVKVNEERIEDSEVNIMVAGDGDIVELWTEKRYLTIEEVGMIDRAYSDAVKGEIERALEICQHRYKTDLFGIGEHFRRNMPTKKWKEIEKDWTDIFCKLKVNINVDMRIRRRGMTLYAVEMVE